MLAEKAVLKAKEKGKAESWTDVQIANMERMELTKPTHGYESGQRLGVEHNEAFSKIVPYWGVSALPYGSSG